MRLQWELPLLVASLAAQSYASCAYGTLLQPRAEGEAVEVNKFGYVGLKGPTNWVALDPVANALCATGKSQSPIDMVAGSFASIPAAQLSLAIPDMPNGTTFENLGTTVEVVAKGGTMSFNGTAFTLQQFHFHLPSEHLDNGTSMAMEMHMVWQNAAGQIAVIGVFIDVNEQTSGASKLATNTKTDTISTGRPSTSGAATTFSSETKASQPANPMSKEQFSRRLANRQASKDSQSGSKNLPSVEWGFFHVKAPKTGFTTPSAVLDTILGSVEKIRTPGTSTKTEPVDMSALVKTLLAGSFHTYEGSLTTPPCSEGVRWLVSDQTLSIQPQTFKKARSVIGFNARFVQNFPGQDNVLSLAPTRA